MQKSVASPSCLSQKQTRSSTLGSRLLAPHFAHLHARSLRELASMGAMLDLSHDPEVLSRWHTCEPLAREAVTWQGQVLGVPIGLHRANTMLLNLAVWRALTLPAVRSWDDVEGIAPQLIREGIMPMAWSDAGSHLLGLFESLMVATHGAEGHRAWLEELDGSGARDAWTSRPVRDALERLLDRQPFRNCQRIHHRLAALHRVVVRDRNRFIVRDEETELRTSLRRPG